MEIKNVCVRERERQNVCVFTYMFLVYVLCVMCEQPGMNSYATCNGKIVSYLWKGDFFLPLLFEVRSWI